MAAWTTSVAVATSLIAPLSAGTGLDCFPDERRPAPLCPSPKHSRPRCGVQAHLHRVVGAFHEGRRGDSKSPADGEKRLDRKLPLPHLDVAHEGLAAPEGGRDLLLPQARRIAGPPEPVEHQDSVRELRRFGFGRAGALLDSLAGAGALQPPIVPGGRAGGGGFGCWVQPGGRGLVSRLGV